MQLGLKAANQCLRAKPHLTFEGIWCILDRPRTRSFGSMPRAGLFRHLRSRLRDLIWREARAYGDEELAQIKASAEDLKSQVDFLMEAQKKRRQQEEVLMLRELRRTVDALRAESEAVEDQKRAVVEAMDEVASTVDGEMAVRAEAWAQQRFAEILKGLDPDDLLGGATLGNSTRPKQEQTDTDKTK